MAEKYQNEAHQKPVGKMTIEDTEIFLSKDSRKFVPLRCSP